MAYGFVCVRCGRLELAHDGIIAEEDGELASHVKLPGYVVSLKKCKSYVTSPEENRVIHRDVKKTQHAVYKPQKP